MSTQRRLRRKRGLTRRPTTRRHRGLTPRQYLRLLRLSQLIPPKLTLANPPLDENDGFRIVRVEGASNALLVDGKMYTQKQLTSMLSGPLPRRDHHNKRRSRREKNEDPAGSGSSADSNGTDSSHSSGRSSRTGRGRRSRHRRRDDRSGH